MLKTQKQTKMTREKRVAITPQGYFLGAQLLRMRLLKHSFLQKASKIATWSAPKLAHISLSKFSLQPLVVVKSLLAILTLSTLSSCGFVEESLKDLSSGELPLSEFQLQKLHGEEIEDENQIVYADTEPSIEWSESENAARYIVRVKLADDEDSLVCSLSVTDFSLLMENCGIPEDTLVRITVQAVGRSGKAKSALKRPYFMLDRTAPVVSFTSTPGSVVNVDTPLPFGLMRPTPAVVFSAQSADSTLELLLPVPMEVTTR
ncbi:MAG: hypothetical protein COT74_00210 [Bdellovibrionales bacterium CG10_big_fil_rev_8_21_14_0_10_45_34]|nr:MAG: hypothetical protein COT74_00210 [Bdellovibrionales bacterium CG10_big_fil_rev_8_21_14_0_10_45_34]